MLKKNYLLVTVLSFMFISPAFTMEDEDGRSTPIPETSREEKASQAKEAEPQPPSSQQSAEQKAPREDLKKDPTPSTKPSKKGRGCCCLFRTEDDD